MYAIVSVRQTQYNYNVRSLASAAAVFSIIIITVCINTVITNSKGGDNGSINIFLAAVEVSIVSIIP